MKTIMPMVYEIVDHEINSKHYFRVVDDAHVFIVCTKWKGIKIADNPIMTNKWGMAFHIDQLHEDQKSIAKRVIRKYRRSKMKYM